MQPKDKVIWRMKPMSTMIVNQLHLNSILSYCLSEGYIESRSIARKIGLQMLRVNYQAYNKDYGERNRLPNAIDFETNNKIQSPVAFIKACHCYLYQIDSVSDRNKTLVSTIESWMLLATQDLPGYESAPWLIYE